MGHVDCDRKKTKLSGEIFNGYLNTQHKYGESHKCEGFFPLFQIQIILRSKERDNKRGKTCNQPLQRPLS